MWEFGHKLEHVRCCFFNFIFTKLSLAFEWKANQKEENFDRELINAKTNTKINPNHKDKKNKQT